MGTKEGWEKVEQHQGKAHKRDGRGGMGSDKVDFGEECGKMAEKWFFCVFLKNPGWIFAKKGKKGTSFLAKINDVKAPLGSPRSL